MKQAILDTDILSAFLRGNPIVEKKVKSYLLNNPKLNFTIITYYEVLNGLLYKDAKQQLQTFQNFAQLNHIIPLTKRSVEISAKIFANLRKEGLPIGHTDTLIAGIAIDNDMVLVSNNTSHFNRIGNLELDNWL